MSIVMNKNSILEEAKSGIGRVDKRSVEKIINKYNLQISHLSNDIVEAFYLWITDSTPKLCEQCNKPLKFFGFNGKYKTNFCSVKCATPYNLNKAKQTIQEKFGVEHQMHLSIVKEKIKNTNLQRYGASSWLKSNECKQRLQEKFSVVNNSQRKEIKEKAKNTFDERFGGRTFSNRSTLNEESRKKLSIELEIDWPNNFSFQQLSSWKISKQLIFDTAIKSNFHNINIEYKEDGNRIISATHDCGTTQSWNAGYACLRCIHCYPKNSSQFERQVCDYLKNELNLKFTINDRSIIPPLELDFYIEDKKVAIECNGDYWHSYSSSESIYEKNRHMNKADKCDEVGIRLIQIPEYLWNSKQEQIKSIIKSAIGQNEKIAARNTIVKEISNKKMKSFCEQYHIQGGCNAKKSFGCFYKDELVFAMSISPGRFKQNYGLEIIRSVSKCGITVVGGQTKLITFIKQQYNENLHSYIDRNFFNAQSYKNKIVIPPGYVWILNSIIYSRYQCQKKKLKKLLGTNFNPQLTETQNMFNCGARRLWNSGNFLVLW